MRINPAFIRRDVDGLACIGRTTFDLRGIRFAEGEDGDPGEEQQAWPKETAVAEMSPDQQAAYYKFHSRKHENREKELQGKLDERADYDDLKTQLEQLRTQGLSDQERALEEAREEARLAGENIGAAKYARAAVRGHVDALVARAQITDSDEVQEAINGLIGSLDVNTLLTETGDVDTEKIGKIIRPLIASGGTRQGASDSYSQTIRNGRQDVQGAGSIAAYQAKYAEKYNKN